MLKCKPHLSECGSLGFVSSGVIPKFAHRLTVSPFPLRGFINIYIFINGNVNNSEA